MKRACCFIIGLWFVASGYACAQEPLIRTSLNPSDVWKGQKVTLVVELLVPGYFSDSPTFDLPDPPGILLLPPNVNPVVSTEEIGGISYTKQRHELSIFSQRTGPQNISELTVRFHYKRNPIDKETIAVTLKTPPVHLSVKAPPGSEKLGNLISAHKLEVSDVWKPNPKDVIAKPGTAFTRTITFKAENTPAMAFPPFSPENIDGLGIYKGSPEVTDKTSRGDLTGQRRDVITYICQRPGQFIIPPTQLTWFDLDSQQLRIVSFPEQLFNVTGVIAAVKKRPTFNPSVLLAWIASFSFLVLISWRNRSYFQAVRLAKLNPP